MNSFKIFCIVLSIFIIAIAPAFSNKNEDFCIKAIHITNMHLYQTARACACNVQKVHGSEKWIEDKKYFVYSFEFVVSDSKNKRRVNLIYKYSFKDKYYTITVDY
jgi:hypothetical protein